MNIRAGNPFVRPSGSDRFTREGASITKIYGPTEGLKSVFEDRLKKLYRRKIDPDRVIGPDLARDLADLSLEMGRQIGLLIDRRGQVAQVILGEARRLGPLEQDWRTGGLTRLSGLRLVHTHLHDDGLDPDDLGELAQKRLDLVAALLIPPGGGPPSIDGAYLMPSAESGEGVGRFSARHTAELNLDLTAHIRALEEEITRRQILGREVGEGDRALLVSVTSLARAEAEERLLELEDLAKTAGLKVMGQRLYRAREAASKRVLSAERLRELNILALQNGVDLIVFDQNLAPSQISWLMGETDLRILDRTQLILDIFAQRARTREGKLQVELAQIKYLMPRLTLKDSGLSRLTGGIGARGPGETKLEVDRRRVRDRMNRLKKDLDQVKVQRGLHRTRRARAGLPVVSIVGYTNAGKSTLLNHLTRSDVLAENKLFATLDPTSRRLKFPRNQEIIITDTVGFIRDLPPDLVEAFSATLEELESADLLIHLIDAAGRDMDRRIETVEKILGDLDLGGTPTLRVFSKMDLVEPEKLEGLQHRYDALAVNALNPITFSPLIEAISRRFGFE
jgi:GTP-binding protein HflX